MTAVLARPAPIRSAPPRVDADAGLDRVVRLTSGLVVWSSLLLVSYWWVAAGGVTDLLSGWGPALTSVGRLTGLTSAALLLWQVIMMARLPPVEDAFGRDRLTRIHRVVGFVSFDLMLAHVVTILLGYADARWSLLPSTIWDLVTTGGGILLSLAGMICLIMVAATSIRRARRRLRYESWHLLHLYAYLGVGLALPHQLWTGQAFVSSPGRAVFWWVLWATAAGAILIWRVLVPLARSVRHGLRVTSVHRESSDVVSVYLTGRRLDLLPVRAGQFLTVRFLDGPGWTRANPFSLSAAPDGRSLRITAKALGSGSARLAHLRPGTRVLFEGPYGRLSSRARTQPKLLLVGAGVGITPIRALAEGLAYAPGDAVLLDRFTAEPLFADELQLLAVEKGLQVIGLPGARQRPDSVLGPAAGDDELAALTHWIPDLAQRDVYLCGPTTWTTGFEQLAMAAGVPRTRIHSENFGW